MATSTHRAQFGIFLPIANGGWITSRTAPPVDGSFDLNKRTTILAEGLGFDFVLSMMKWRGFGGAVNHWGHSLESMMLMSALSQVTSRIKLWCTVHTLLHNPAVAAKMVATLDHASGGRAGLNVVSGSYRDEFVQMGEWRDDLDHDRRYALAEEWLDAVKRLWIEPRVDLAGRFFTLADCVCDPKPLARPRPTLICAGISEVGLQLVARHADAAFVHGKDDPEIAANSRRAKAIAAEHGKTIQTFIYITVIPGATDEEAQAREAHYREGIDLETVRGMAAAFSHNPRQDGKANTLVLRAQRAFMSSVISGSADTLRRALVNKIRTADLDGVMFMFPDFIEDQRFFGERVLPDVRHDLKSA
ncbi:MAG: LLM class flavin-dependent oxidoreductase [Alphaproteobacteria bacterium]|nr:LLM class flavin-dependent oxidoreductase [Alphaproteobacteria bacterium]